MNHDGNVAIITFWTQTRIIIDKLYSNKILYEHTLSVGNLYTVDGFKYIILNSYLTTNIKQLLFVGNDRNNIWEYVNEFFTKQNESKLYQLMLSQMIDSFGEDTDSIISMFIDRFKNNYKRISIEELQQFTSSDVSVNKISINLHFYNLKLDAVNRQLPSEEVGFVFRNNNLDRLWKDVMSKICKFGTLQKLSQEITDSDYYELIDCLYVLCSKDRDVESIINDSQFALSENFLNEYAKQIISGDIPKGFAYTYGNRITETYETVLDKLRKSKCSRQAFICLYHSVDIEKMISNESVRCGGLKHASNVGLDEYTQINNYNESSLDDHAQTKSSDDHNKILSLNDSIKNYHCDLHSSNPPCLTDITINIQNNKLYLSAHFRSHDVFGAFRTNIYGLCKLQEKILNDLSDTHHDLILGDLSVYSNSCHLYVRDYKKISKTIFPTNCMEDFRGYFIINTDLNNRSVCVNHYNYSNELLHTFIIDDINNTSQLDNISEFVSDIHHAMYVQREVCKAFFCMKLGLVYNQDNEL